MWIGLSGRRQGVVACLCEHVSPAVPRVGHMSPWHSKFIWGHKIMTVNLGTTVNCERATEGSLTE
jgi:hypothetical protein